MLAACTEVILTSPPGDVIPPDAERPEDLSPPEAICSFSPSDVAPFEPVDVVGELSYDPDDIPLISYRWSLAAQPDGSTAALPDGQANLPGFVPDLAGSYTATLIVTNDRGNQSTTCATTLDVVPDKGLWVELFWTYPDENLDLHLVRDVASPGRDDNCSVGACDGLDWGRAGDAADDPVLVNDDVTGTGPEAIGIEAAATGSFIVAAFDDNSHRRAADNEATVRIWLDGVLAWTGTRIFEEEGDFLEFARVNAATGAITEL
jgi:hypothetical protein